MEKHKFVTEYELRSSPKVLFPYISTASGLEQWFAEKVNILPDHRFDFLWDGESHVARQAAHRLNKAVRYEFLDGEESDTDLSYIEMKLEVSELTQSTYLKVIDYSQNADEQELLSMWNGLIDSLKEIVGS
jgi:uncharacterized protein YndB with AHSA1/START domain